MDPGYVNPYLQPAFVREKGGSATFILRNRYKHTQYPLHTHAYLLAQYMSTYAHTHIHAYTQPPAKADALARSC
jgi:hypothetical protein